MLARHFNNINGYKEDRYTTAIPNAAVDDCRAAWRFAKTINHPMNMHVHFDLPDSVSPEQQREVYRYFVNKLRVHADYRGYLAIILMVRSCDPDTNKKAKIDFLVHVPDVEQNDFRKVVSLWKYSPKTISVDYAETSLPDGKISSIFNDLFGATTYHYAAAHPDLPQHRSGNILGHRTFYSRHLWLKQRILHARLNKAIV